MDGNHPNPIDPRPKRRRDKYNPYKIFTSGIETDTPRYYISFRDVTGSCHCLQIDRKLFETFERFELDDLSFLNEVDRHYDTSEQPEESLYNRAIRQGCSVEETVLWRVESQELHQAIALLPEIQRRRLILYYFDGLTYQQIADMEGNSKTAVVHSITLALEKIKKIFSDWVTF